MKILVLARNADLYSHKRLVEAAHARGHEIDVIDTLKIYLNVSGGEDSIHYAGKVLDKYDAVIPRIGASITSYGLAVLRQFELMGTWPLNGSLGIMRSRDKLRSMQVLARKGLPLPVTAFSNSSSSIDDMISMVGGVPLIVKLLEGTQGIGVILCETKSSARSVIEGFLGVNVNILVQEFIKEAKGADIRCLVVGGKVVAAIERQGSPDEFRANIHRGGTAKKIRLTKQERDIAIRSAKAMGLDVCGVDLLRSSRGPLVLEVNSSPGLEGIEKASGVNVADTIIDYIERNVGKTSPKSRLRKSSSGS
ncbi:30S ribosomal protein S6--L-glutamate ligase [Candidatus Bealeia paramacronuclearis]|uniref:Probable alpha-L-glutamate ligase n=1 Tax=Candidatus Bealeia paramacronuclearis TaxID=1921001 RepID=A0ABZ2C6F0_9PROT|nr:30S ribosomal protein S6--L-glutamate ligase [Candidatus Bealeia paramacronuclearis]